MSSPVNATTQWVDIDATTVTTTTAGTAIAVGTPTKPVKKLILVSTSDKDLVVTFNGVELVSLPALATMQVPLAGDGLILPAGLVLGVYKRSATPTVGRVSATFFG
jgi:hypothetical protein